MRQAASEAWHGQIIRLLGVLLILGLGSAESAHGQFISLKTAPVATGDQFRVFPSTNGGMGALSIAVTDSLGDPFVNPAKAARLRGTHAFSAPLYYTVTGNDGAARTLPVGALFGAGAWFGGVNVAMQELETADVRPPVFIADDWGFRASTIVPPPRPDRLLRDQSKNNYYATALIGRRLTDDLALAGRMFWAGLEAIDGVDLLEQPRAAKRVLGYLPERPPLYPDMRVTEYLSFCAALHGVPRSERGRACERALLRCGLTDVRERLIDNLSQGYQQRVGIAQAILHQPLAVVLDEPTVGLDPIQIGEIRSLIAELGRDHGVILSTHILAEVHAVCSRVQILHQGRTVFGERMDRLDRGAPSAQVTVRLAHAPRVQELESLPGVRSAEALADGRWHLALDDTTAVDAVAAAIVEHGWGLRELTPRRHSLEQIFVAVTTRDAPEAAA